jgi:hypothetical protein
VPLPYTHKANSGTKAIHPIGRTTTCWRRYIKSAAKTPDSEHRTALYSPETAKAPCGTSCPESAHTLFVSEVMQKRWIIAAL